MTKLVNERDTHLSSDRSPTSGSTPQSDNVFSVLAQQAAARTPAELWMTTAGGSINAALIWWQYPGIWWLGAGFCAVAAYGVWGLADHEISDHVPQMQQKTRKTDLIVGARGLAVPIGVVSAILAVGGFMAAALGGWNH